MKDGILCLISGVLLGGGGAGFLHFARQELRERDLYSESPYDAQVLLLNSIPFRRIPNHYTSLARYLKKVHGIKVIARVDGPISLTRGKPLDIHLDKVNWQDAQDFADGVVFQSNWSESMHRQLGFDGTLPQRVIRNGAPRIFSKPRAHSEPKNSRLRVAASSWSANCNKGFSTLIQVGANLDPSRFELTFVGNSSANLPNFVQKRAMDKLELADFLFTQDIFLAPSFFESCSNSLIEAILSGAHPFARNHGGHSEIVLENQFLFDSDEDLIERLNRINRQSLSSPAGDFSIGSSVESYVEFAKSLNRREKTDVSTPITIFNRKVLINSPRAETAISQALRRAHPRLKFPVLDLLQSATSTATDERRIDNEDDAIQALDGARIFLRSMVKCEGLKGISKLTMNGDLHEQMVFANVFALRARHLLSMEIPEQQVNLLWESIDAHGKVSEPSLKLENLSLRVTDSRVMGGRGRLERVGERQTAQTRQTLSVLKTLGKLPFIAVEPLTHDLESRIHNWKRSDWNFAWNAGAQASHLLFFTSMLEDDSLKTRLQSEIAANAVFELERILQDRKTSREQFVNGLMKLVTGLRWMENEINVPTQIFIDAILSHITESHSCNHLNALVALRYFTSLDPGYREDEVISYAQQRLYAVSKHWWPSFGGFSFYERRSQHTYLGARVSLGLPEPDLHGTVMSLWAMSEVSMILGWDKATIKEVIS